MLFELSAASPTSSLFLGDMGVQLGALTPVFYAFRDREYVAQPDRGGHRRPLPPQLRPHRRPQGRPAQGLDRPTPRPSWRRSATFCDEMEELLARQRDLRGPHPGHRRDPRRRRPRPTACPAPTCGPAGSTGTSAATRRSAWPGTRSTGRSGPTPTATRFARYWVRLQETREATKIVDQLLDGLPAGPIMAKVPRIIKVPAGEAWVATENPLGEMGYYVVCKGDLGPVPGEDPLGQLQQHLDRAVGDCGACTCPTSSRSWPASTSSSETSTGERSLAVELVVLAADDPHGPSACWPRCCCRPAPSSTSSCSR